MARHSSKMIRVTLNGYEVIGKRGPTRSHLRTAWNWLVGNHGTLGLRASSGRNHAFCQEKLIEEKDLIGIRKFAMAAFAGVFTAR